ncbi:MAG: GSCFA domain-containing protein [Spirochaetales bacterium]|nr:GSCFA domain-containing protein [Spirochaetales bacterium]
MENFNFRTELKIKKSQYDVNFDSKLLFIGSCFAENIGNKFTENKFETIVNPFGTNYNPISIFQSLDRIIDEKLFSTDDLFFADNLWKSLLLHSNFSNNEKENFLEKINKTIADTHVFLRKADFLVMTFGTSMVYEEVNTKQIVANCHKLPDKNFNRYRLESGEIYKKFKLLHDKLSRLNPKIKIIMTISPVRHLKDGFFENNLNKAVLFDSISQIIKNFENVEYFPSYEIMMDDLRDYRFYSEDMVHPNGTAIDYIYAKFSNAYFSNQTLENLKIIRKIMKNVRHRPVNSGSQSYRDFCVNSLDEIKAFTGRHPQIDMGLEKDFFESALKK